MRVGLGGHHGGGRGAGPLFLRGRAEVQWKVGGWGQGWGHPGQETVHILWKLAGVGIGVWNPAQARLKHPLGPGLPVPSLLYSPAIPVIIRKEEQPASYRFSGMGHGGRAVRKGEQFSFMNLR